MSYLYFILSQSSYRQTMKVPFSQAMAAGEMQMYPPPFVCALTGY